LATQRFSFNGAKLRGLKPPRQGRLLVYDSAVRGLTLEITANGARSFRVYRKFKGRPVKITLGRFGEDLPETRELPSGAAPIDLLGNHPALNVRMARKLAMAVMAELDAGANPAEGHGRRGMTLGELFARYRSYLLAQGKKTTVTLAWTWERYLGELPAMPRKPRGAARSKAPGAVNWERRPVAEITPEQVAKLRLDLGEKVGRTTANRVTELLRAMYNFGAKQRLYEGRNPAQGNGKFQLASRERFLEPDEAPRFFTALSDEPDQDFADYVRLSLFTGARRGNVLRMRWDDLSLDGARWTVAGEFMKNGQPLTIPLVQEAVEILRRRSDGLKESQWVFPGGTAKGHAGPQRKKWDRLLTRAGLTDLHVHDLRRSLGSWMAASGASTVVTMRALGHRSINAALIYQRLAADPVREAMQRAVTAMEKSGRGEKGRVAEMPRKAAQEGRND